MSLVGPRPEDPAYVDLADPLHRRVFSAKPGITGLAQLEYHDEADLLAGPDADQRYRRGDPAGEAQAGRRVPGPPDDAPRPQDPLCGPFAPSCAEAACSTVTAKASASPRGIRATQVPVPEPAHPGRSRERRIGSVDGRERRGHDSWPRGERNLSNRLNHHRGARGTPSSDRSRSGLAPARDAVRRAGRRGGFVVSNLEQPVYEARARLIVGQALSAANPDYSQLSSRRTCRQHTPSSLKRARSSRPLIKQARPAVCRPARSRAGCRWMRRGTAPSCSSPPRTRTRRAPLRSRMRLAAQLIDASPTIQGREAAFQAIHR